MCLYLILDGRKLVFGGVILFKKLFLLLTVITLSTLTSFPAFANTLSIISNKDSYDFKYIDFKENINNVEKLNKELKNTEADEIVTEILNDDSLVENMYDDSTTASSENINPSYISNFIMESTAYTGGTLTATGIAPVRDEYGISTIAVDSSIIPLGSLLYIDGYGYAIAADTGAAVQGYIIDLYLNSYDECINWGRQNVSVYLIAYPGQW